MRGFPVIRRWPKVSFSDSTGNVLAALVIGKEVDLDRLMQELEEEIAGSQGEEQRWDARPLPELIDYILVQYHAPLKEELPRLEQMAENLGTDYLFSWKPSPAEIALPTIDEDRSNVKTF